ncbi:hypothetical protein GCM10009827_033550 [Dactylosporangium maewongense]|uniref:Uncharacterized protein n=1 Tax=Dactylosporangium maewongense TaxID=634393 RepID=A0ABP4L737_9ACTN
MTSRSRSRIRAASGGGGADEEHAELLAAVAGQGVAGAQQRPPRGRRLLQQPVAGLVAEGVVEALEVVEVQQRHADIGAAAAGLRHLPLQLQVPGAAVGHPGQAVVVRRMPARIASVQDADRAG